MARGQCTFRQRDLAAAIRAAKSAGMDIGRVEVAKDGNIVLFPGAAENAEAKPAEGNEWDDAV